MDLFRGGRTVVSELNFDVILIYEKYFNLKHL